MSSSDGLLAGKRILITGVLTDASLAFGVARRAQAEGAELVLSGAGRGLSLTRRTARKLDAPVDVIEIDVTDPAHLRAAAADLTARWGRLDGILHAIGFAPQDCLGGDILRAEWEEVAVALQVSAYSLKALVGALRPLLVAAGQLVGGGPRLRRPGGVAGLRLDGRGQGRARVPGALPGARPRPRRGPGQPGGRRPGAHHGGQVDPELQGLRGHLG